MQPSSRQAPAVQVTPSSSPFSVCPPRNQASRAYNSSPRASLPTTTSPGPVRNSSHHHHYHHHHLIPVGRVNIHLRFPNPPLHARCLVCAFLFTGGVRRVSPNPIICFSGERE